MHKHTPKERADELSRRILDAMRAAMATQGAKYYAAELGICHETLLHKTDPENPKDNLTLQQFLRLLDMVDAGLVLRPLAESLGGQWLSLPSAQAVGTDMHRLLTLAAKEFGDIAACLLAATDPDSPGGAGWTEAELDQLDKEIDEAVVHARALLAAARACKVPAHTNGAVRQARVAV